MKFILFKLPIILVYLFLLPCCAKEPLTLHILETTDLHGEMGTAMSATAKYIRQARTQYGKNLLVLDCGDNFQGSSELFYSNYIDTTSRHISSTLFNWLGYDAMAVGNHDFEVGEPLFKRAYAKMKAPVLCANIVRAKNQKPLFKPYTVIKRGGYKIAILGIVSPHALAWLPDNLRYGCEFLPIRESAQEWVDVIYKKEKPDVVIGLFHTGNNPQEFDAASWLAEHISGIHLICCGHNHQASVNSYEGQGGQPIWVMEAGAYASHIAEAVISITPRGKDPVAVTATAKIIPTDGLPKDEEYELMIAPFMEKTTAFYDVPIASIDTTIYSRDAIVGPCAWTDFLHRSYVKIAEQMGFSGYQQIDLTIASASSEKDVLEKGALTIRDFLKLYPFQNTMSIIEMTGNEVTAYLEYVHNLQLQYPQTPVYDFDSMGGLEYRVSVGKPMGERVTIYSIGPLKNKYYSDRRYRVAVSTFRALGGGGHFEAALGWNSHKMQARTVAASEKVLRAMLMDIYQGQTLDVSEDYHWAYNQ